MDGFIEAARRSGPMRRDENRKRDAGRRRQQQRQQQSSGDTKHGRDIGQGGTNWEMPAESS
jgi:hypothetical protein